MHSGTSAKTIMFTKQWIAIAGLALLATTGCGGGSTLGSGRPPQGTVPISGNWTFTPPLTQLPPMLPPFVGGSLTASGNRINGDILVLLINNSCPLTGDLGVTLSGSVANSQLKLVSSAWNGGVFTVEGTVAADGKTISATWSMAGGCADGESGSMIASYVPPLSGTLTGTASAPPDGNTNSLTGSPVTIDVQQAATPRDFAFPLSGTVKITGTGCGFTDGKLIQVDDRTALAPSSIVGDELTMEAQMDDGKSLAIIAGQADLIQPGKWITVVLISGGACDGAAAEVVLSAA